MSIQLIRKNNIAISPVKETRCLDVLLAQCQTTDNMPDDINAWLNIEPVGQKIQ